MKTLEDAVAAAADTAAARRAEIAEIETQFAAENRAIWIANQEREQHLSASTRGDAHALAAVQKAQADQQNAERRLADLVNHRRPAAMQSLAAAEQAELNAKRAFAKPHVEALKRECVVVSARWDTLMAEAVAVFELLQRHHLELLSHDLGDSGMTSRFEAAMGLRRISDAVAHRRQTDSSHPRATPGGAAQVGARKSAAGGGIGAGGRN
jgi:hypothetical protein